LRRSGHPSLDRNVTNDRLIIGANLGRHSHHAGGHDTLRHPGAYLLLALIDLAKAFGLQFSTATGAAKAVVFLGQPTDFHAFLAQDVDIFFQPTK